MFQLLTRGLRMKKEFALAWNSLPYFCGGFLLSPI